MSLSPKRRKDIIQALRQGTVPDAGLDALAVGINHFVPVLDEELHDVSTGSSNFKAIRGEYGSGKTFFTRFLAERAAARGFATAEVQISETETPLHKLETVYRKVIETLKTQTLQPSAFRKIIETWFYGLEEEAINAEPHLGEANADTEALTAAVNARLEARLEELNSTAPGFAPALRGYRAACDRNDHATADALIDWLAGQPHVAAAAKRSAGIRGNLDHFGAMGSLQGLLTILRDAGHPGLLLVLDEVETLQRVRGDVRDKALNALRQLIDEVSSGRYPGLYLVITGTPPFFTGEQGVRRLQPLAMRLATDFDTDPKFDTGRAVQLRLVGFDHAKLVELGCKVRDLYADGTDNGQHIRDVVDDAFITDFSQAVAGKLGGKVGMAPRVYLKKLVADILDRVNQFPEFNPRTDYSLAISPHEVEIELRGSLNADDVDLDLDTTSDSDESATASEIPEQ